MANSVLFLPLFFLLPFVVDSLYFNITSFQPNDPSENIAYHGDAAPDGDGTVNFNSDTRTSQVGWITYSKEVPIWSRRTGNASDFNTSFSFKIDTRNLSTDSHGICFFLAPMGAQLPAYTVGGFLGLFGNNDYRSSFDLVHIEFDTYSNPGWDPRDVGSHVGINNNSLVSSNYTSWNASLHSQDIGHAHVTYDSVNKNLSVTWGYELTASDDESSSLSYIIDLAKVLPSEVMFGFIAAAGANTGEHRLLSWELSSSLDPEKADNKTGLIIGIAVTGVVLVTFLVITTVVVWSRKQRKRNTREITTMVSSSIDEDLEKEAGPRKFSFKDLVSATDGFSHQRKLGEGGFGAVYSGNLKEINMMVAVKKLSCGSRQGKKEFLNEVRVISKLRHRNLVQLVGWCNEESEFLLIYELMPNGGLNSHLFGKREEILSWDTRYKIALGLASAILYLHEEWDQCVLHRDIKASNIMLDGDFNVKLGDFGLARVMSHKLDSHKTGLAGTFGYMAPEYVMTGCASKESDMYSFGIVLLEIVTGRKSLERSKEDEEEEGNSDDDDEKSLVEKVWELYGRREELLSSGVDERLGDDFNIEEAECLLVLGLWCGHPDKSSRPSIKQAIQVMKLESPLPANLPLKRPVATYYNSTSSSSPLSANSSRASITFSSKEVGR